MLPSMRCYMLHVYINIDDNHVARSIRWRYVFHVWWKAKQSLTNVISKILFFFILSVWYNWSSFVDKIVMRSENEASFQRWMYIQTPQGLGGGGYLKASEVKKIIRVISLRFLIKYFFHNKTIEKGLNTRCFGMKYITFYSVLLQNL